MSQSKLWAFHAEADKVPELVAKIEEGLAEIKAKAAAGGAKVGTAATPAAATGSADAKKPLEGEQLEKVKHALTALKTAVDGDAPEKKLGIKAVKTVLKKFGVTESPALVGEQFAPCLEAIAAAMPKEDETF